ncbi:MAG: TIGR03767 family metallophosphoesterase [Actinomycetota bacterium]
MNWTRRQFLGAIAGAGAVAALEGTRAGRLFGTPAFADGPWDETTVVKTIRALGATGYVRLGDGGAGEPHLVRDEMAPARAGRETTRVSLLYFAHLTDIHIIDTQSPLRPEFLDPTSFSPSPAPFNSAWRPHEPLTTHVLEAMVRRVNRIPLSPLSGAAMNFVLAGGDAADNAQLNEARWFVDILDGGRITPDSGTKGVYEGVQRASYPNPAYWHPDDPSRDQYGIQFGFPLIPGLLEASIAPFMAEGLRVPWLSMTGNHDTLWQGNCPTEGAAGVPFAAIATSGAKPEGGATPDREREILKTRDWIAQHFATPSRPGPVGHGFTQENLRSGTGYYARNEGNNVRLIVLDSVNPNGYANGSLDAAQMQWLESELISCHSRYLTPAGDWATTGNTNRLVILTGHHSLYSMDNPLIGPVTTEPRVLGDQVTALLARFPNIVLYVGGHVHENRIVAHPGPDGSYGFWEIATASHIDWPQQSRILELLDNKDSTLSVWVTVFDHVAPASPGTGFDVIDLASISRELSYNDPQSGANGGKNFSALEKSKATGQPIDRNVELILRAPF